MKYDLIIIGAGPAGIATAEYFINSSKKVLIIESGNFDNIQNYNSKNDNVVGDFSIDFAEERKRAFFGTTSLWRKSGVGGTFWEFDYNDFQTEDFLKWNIDYRELKEIYNRAWNYLNTRPENLNLIPNLGNLNFKELINKYSVKAASSFYTFGATYAEFILKKKKELINSKNINLLFNTHLEKIILNKEKNKVEQIITSSTINKQKIEFYSKNFVLAAGCFENNRILINLNEQNKLNMESLGKYLTFHPGLNIGEINVKQNTFFYKNAIKKLKKVFILKNKEDLKYNDLNYGLTINPIFKEPSNSKNIIKKISIIRDSFFKRNLQIFLSHTVKFFWSLEIIKYLIYKFKSYFISINKLNISIIFEHLPNSSSLMRINKKNNSINIRSNLSARNKKFIKSKILKNQLILKNIFPEFISKNIDFDNLKFETNNHHHGGTIIGNNKKGVVDKNLRVKKIKNLYVTGSSTFPNSSIYNPTLTIIAISLRLSEHIFQIND